LRIDAAHRFDDDRKNAVAAGELMDEAQIIQRVGALRTEHRDLDSAIDALRLLGTGDQLQIARMKKRKLALRDEIAMLEDQLIPDIIA
jgi:hypothetical protein